MKSESGFASVGLSAQNAPSAVWVTLQDTNLTTATEVIKQGGALRFSKRWWEMDWFKEWERLARPRG